MREESGFLLYVHRSKESSNQISASITRNSPDRATLTPRAVMKKLKSAPQYMVRSRSRKKLAKRIGRLPRTSCVCCECLTQRMTTNQLSWQRASRQMLTFRTLPSLTPQSLLQKTAFQNIFSPATMGG